MTRGDFWAGIGVLVASMWMLGTALEKEFIKRMNRLTDFLDALDRDRNSNR